MRKTKQRIAALMVLMMTAAMLSCPVFADTECGSPAGPEVQPGVEDSSGAEAVTGQEEQPVIEEQAEMTDGTEPAVLDEPEQQMEPAELEGLEDPPAQVAVPSVSVARKGPALCVSWAAVPGADYYEVYRSYSAAERGSFLKKVSGSASCTDKNVASGKTAYYKVRAHRTDGSFSEYSAAVPGVVYRVYIEVGHGIDRNGRWDSGCTWKKYQEAKLMLPICKSMAKYLRAHGVYVYTDADKGNNRNLKWLLKNLKGYNVSVLVNVHCDYKGAKRGTLPLYRYGEQKKLAKCLNAGVHKTVKIKDRGLKKRTDLGSLNKTKSYCTACLYETGNIKKDNKVLRKKYDAYGKGLAMGVCSYLGVAW